MRTLVIGDPHLREKNLDEAEIFLSQILHAVGTGRHDRVIILGDLFNDFAVIRSEVLSLWLKFTEKLQHMFEYRFPDDTKTKRIIYVVGNHDMAGHSGGTHSLESFKAFPRVKVIDDVDMVDGIYFMPFIREKASFEDVCRGIPEKSVLICHQSFQGSKFENGFYDPDGADPECVKHLKAVISGHIHAEQELFDGIIWYPGTPFQHSFGEAGQKKQIWEINLTSKGYTRIAGHEMIMHQYHIVETETVDKLLEAVTALVPSQNASYKLRAQGTIQEIQKFKESDAFRSLKKTAKKVVDDLTPTRQTVSLPGSEGQTLKEKLHGFIKSKTWRTTSAELAVAAEKYLTR